MLQELQFSPVIAVIVAVVQCMVPVERNLQKGHQMLFVLDVGVFSGDEDSIVPMSGTRCWVLCDSQAHICMLVMTMSVKKDHDCCRCSRATSTALCRWSARAAGSTP